MKGKEEKILLARQGSVKDEVTSKSRTRTKLKQLLTEKSEEWEEMSGLKQVDLASNKKEEKKTESRSYGYFKVEHETDEECVKKNTSEGTYSQKMADCSNELIVMANQSPRKRKKKKKPPQDNSIEMDTFEQKHKNISKEKNPEKKKSKSKQNLKSKNIEEESGNVPLETIFNEAEPSERHNNPILGIVVHHSDQLKSDPLLSNPAVRIHIVDMNSGKYLKKLHESRAVSFYYETQRDVDYILPMMTQPYNICKKKSLTPFWEELLIWNEDFDYFLQDDPKTLVIFEIVDVISPSRLGSHFRFLQGNHGCSKIAWAFLKLVGANGSHNTERKVRLQLYRPPFRSFQLQQGSVEVYQWWSRLSRVIYPATLYVSVKSLVPPETVEPSLRSFFPMQQESGHTTFEDMQQKLNSPTVTTYLDGESVVSSKKKSSVSTPLEWMRLAGQACKVPNTQILQLPSSQRGCFVVKFSNNGRRLAAGCLSLKACEIVLYEIPSGNQVTKFSGHSGNIYDLDWSSDDSYLLSASADGTIRIWNTEKLSSFPLAVLPHPSYVYSARFHPHISNIVVSAGFDHVLYVWKMLPLGGEQPELVQELEGHHSMVNSLCWDSSQNKLYSADGDGKIIVWKAGPCTENEFNQWTKEKIVSLPELKGVPLNSLSLHPSKRKLLVSCRDGSLRLIDINVDILVQHFTGVVNFHYLLRTCLSPCGGLVFSGGEDGPVHVWNTNTGDKLTVFTNLPYKQPVTCVDYHPLDHMFAMCAPEEEAPVLVFKYSPKEALLGVRITPKSSTPKHSKYASQSETSSLAASPEKGQMSRYETIQLTSTPVPSKLASDSSHLNPAIKQMEQQISDSPKKQSVSVEREKSVVSSDNLYSSTIRKSITFDPALDRHSRLKQVLHKLDSVMMVTTTSETGTYVPSLTSPTNASSPLGYAHSSDSTFPGSATLCTRRSSLSQPRSLTSDVQHPKSHNKSQKFVALYDYQPERQDELKLKKGCVITVLDHENHHWWYGELESGKKGYFPANYITHLDVDSEDSEVIEDDSNESYTAVLTESGKLNIVAASEKEKKTLEILRLQSRRNRFPRRTRGTRKEE
ncbi:jouberin-like isoform X3 [Tachypleus tridentatus]|uniref:jouberin-like isoform X3 n=2 Tax=Tachypleus tridentatus TaxID=6853 RepID=UPI003FD1477C